MEFQSPFHKKRFETLLERDKTRKDDVERQALFYILSSDFLYKKASQFYSFAERAIKTEALQDPYLTSGETVLVALAFSLYAGGYLGDDEHTYTVADTFKFLDDENFELAIQAIRLRYNRG